MTLGKAYSQAQSDYTTNSRNWGNIFHPDVLKLNIDVYKSNQQMTAVFSNGNLERQVDDNGVTGLLTKVQVPFIVPVRYNPDRDTGQDNITWLQSITRNTGTGIAPTADENLKITGFPLWMQWWGWPDWQKN